MSCSDLPNSTPSASGIKFVSSRRSAVDPTETQWTLQSNSMKPRTWERSLIWWTA